MLSSSLYAMSTLSKTASPRNLLSSDCITLYLCPLIIILFKTRPAEGADNVVAAIKAEPTQIQQV